MLAVKGIPHFFETVKGKSVLWLNGLNFSKEGML
jgi:hypothetical protein